MGVSLLCCFFPGSPRSCDKPHATAHGAKHLVQQLQPAHADSTPAAKQQPLPSPAAAEEEEEEEEAQFSVLASIGTPDACRGPRPSPSSNPDPATRPRFSLQHQLSQLQTQLKEEQGRNPCTTGPSGPCSLHAALSVSGTWDPTATHLSRDSRVSDLLKRGSSHLLDMTSSLLDTPPSPCLRQDSTCMQDHPSSHPHTPTAGRPFHSPPTTDPKSFSRARAVTDMGADRCRALALGRPLFPDPDQAAIMTSPAISRHSSLKVDGLPLPLPRNRGSSSRDFFRSGLDLHAPPRVGSRSGPRSGPGSGPAPKSGSELLRLHSAIMLQLREVDVNGMGPTSERRLQMHKSRSLRSGSMNGGGKSSLGHSGSPPVTGPGPGHRSVQVHDDAAAAAARKLQQGRAPCPLPPAAAAVGAKPPLLPACTKGP